MGKEGEKKKRSKEWIGLRSWQKIRVEEGGSESLGGVLVDGRTRRRWLMDMDRQFDVTKKGGVSDLSTAT
jgi:hypothetical protein